MTSRIGTVTGCGVVGGGGVGRGVARAATAWVKGRRLEELTARIRAGSAAAPRESDNGGGGSGGGSSGTTDPNAGQMTFLYVPRGQEVSVLDPMPVKALPGVGYRTARLIHERLAVETCGELRAISERVLIDAFGERVGASLYR
jgi:hypothetical protein